MPDSQGALTPEEGQRIAAFFKETAPGIKCSACGSDDLTIGRHLVELRVFTTGSLVIGGPVYPALPLFCQRCGQMLLFSAVAVGVVEPEPEPVEAEEGPGGS